MATRETFTAARNLFSALTDYRPIPSCASRIPKLVFSAYRPNLTRALGIRLNSTLSDKEITEGCFNLIIEDLVSEPQFANQLKIALLISRHSNYSFKEFYVMTYEELQAINADLLGSGWISEEVFNLIEGLLSNHFIEGRNTLLFPLRAKKSTSMMYQAVTLLVNTFLAKFQKKHSIPTKLNIKSIRIRKVVTKQSLVGAVKKTILPRKTSPSLSPQVEKTSCEEKTICKINEVYINEEDPEEVDEWKQFEGLVNYEYPVLYENKSLGIKCHRAPVRRMPAEEDDYFEWSEYARQLCVLAGNVEHLARELRACVNDLEAKCLRKKTPLPFKWVEVEEKEFDNDFDDEGITSDAYFIGYGAAPPAMEEIEEGAIAVVPSVAAREDKRIARVFKVSMVGFYVEEDGSLNPYNPGDASYELIIEKKQVSLEVPVLITKVADKEVEHTVLITKEAAKEGLEKVKYILNKSIPSNFEIVGSEVIRPIKGLKEIEEAVQAVELLEKTELKRLLSEADVARFAPGAVAFYEERHGRYWDLKGELYHVELKKHTRKVIRERGNIYAWLTGIIW